MGLLALLVACGPVDHLGMYLDFEEIALPDDTVLLTEAVWVPGTDDTLLLLNKDGRVDRVRIDGDVAEAVSSFQLDGVFSQTDCGLISAAFDPDFESNGRVYFGTCLDQTRSGVVRVTLDADGAPVPDSQVEILVVGDDDAPREWHNVGSIGFEPDGVLWALFGDKKVAENGQDPSSPLSALVRVVLSEDGVSAAPGNPGGAFEETVYAKGLRSPWRGTLDDAGRWWVGDVGANDAEELNLIDAPGLNFGWPDHEGDCTACGGTQPPVASWRHTEIHPYMVDDVIVSPTAKRTVWVGPQVQDGAPYDGLLDGHVIFGDYCLGFLRAIQADADGKIVVDAHLGHLEQITSMIEMPDGTLVATTFGICGTGDLNPGAPPPAKLHRAVPIYTDG